MANNKQGKWYALVATFFLYSLLVVDLYRKLVPGGAVEQLRNLVYVAVFGLVVVEMKRSRHLQEMLILAAIMLFIYFISYVINPGYNEVYVSSVVMFISRLWPAYFIGRYTEDWDQVGKMVLLFSPIAIAYSVSLFLIPELLGGESYATIASNLAYVSLIYIYMWSKKKNIIVLACSVFCLVPVFFYGTRAFFLGVILALFMLYILKSSVSRNQVVSLVFFVSIACLIFIIFGNVILSWLAELFPDSRTLSLMTQGDMMDDSNRSSGYYEKILFSLAENPFKIYGFIGDRIFLSSSKDAAVILSCYSHNCILELCMNFGLIVGVVLSCRFLYVLCKAALISFKSVKKNDIFFIFMAFLGVSFINMMVSASYLSDYAIWLLFGLAYKIIQL